MGKTNEAIGARRLGEAHSLRGSQEAAASQNRAACKPSAPAPALRTAGKASALLATALAGSLVLCCGSASAATLAQGNNASAGSDAVAASATTAMTAASYAASSAAQYSSVQNALAAMQASIDASGAQAAASTSGSMTAFSTSGLKAHAWTLTKYPNYYKVWGKAKTTKIAAGKIKNSGWDSLGRTRSVTAKVTYAMVAASAGWRENFDSSCDTISGWGHQRKVSVKLSNGRTYNGYAFNRSHLLADSLGGHAVKENLVTGTRTQNVGNNTQSSPGGMAYTETLARNYLYKHHKGWVYYRATPVYKGKELVCRSVYVDIKSNDGSINKRVEVFNAMNGYKLNYKTGAISKGKTYSVKKAAAKKKAAKKTKKKKTTSTSSSGKYVYITKTGSKYHRGSCSTLRYSKIKVTLANAKSRGYSACKICKP